MPSKKQSGFGLILLVIFLVSLAALVIGAIYYYSEIFRPKQYAQEIISLIGSFKTELANPSTDSVPPKDYQQAVKVLTQRQKTLYSLRDRFDQIKPVPIKMRQLHDDLSFGIEYLLAANADAENKVIFLADLQEIYQALKPDPPPFDQSKASVRVYQEYYEAQIPRVKVLGNQLFDRQDLPSFPGITATQLKAAWQDYEKGLDAQLEFVRAQDSSQPLVGYKPVPPNKQQKEALERGNTFGKLMDEVFSKDITNSLLTYSNFTGISQKEFDERSQRLNSTIDQLKKQYHLTSP